jgi:hydroxyacylglutathione hydrolase
MFFRMIADDKLAQYAYLIGCQKTGDAIVIDPERDVDRYVEMAKAEGLTIVAAAETHIHADFLSGARELAEQHGVKLYLSKEGGPDWQSFWAQDGRYDVQFLSDGDTFKVGNIEIQAVHTPGHTPEHISYLVTDVGGGANEPMGLATGDFVFVGDLGRPDLLESAAGIEGMMEPSARTLYASTQSFLQLPDYLQIWPAHGAGSACGKALGAVPETTVGYERRFSPAIAAAKQGEDAFVEFILEGQPEPPVYFARMKALNRDGVPVLGGVPAPSRLAMEHLGDLAGRDDVVVIDTRSDRLAFYAGHLPGSIYAPLNKSFHTYVGSYFDPELPVYLIAEEDQVDDVVRNLIRIGIDDIKGYFTPDALERYRESGGELTSTEVIDFQELDRRRESGGYEVLDVRRATEYAEGHIPNALNIAHTRLMPRLDEIPSDRPLLVHCKTGGRASAATSFLARNGYEVVAVNDEFEAWEAAASASEEVEAGV